MDEKLPDLFSYLDFRKYLQDYYAARKTVDRGFTHAFICRHLGQKNAKSYFNNVVKGRIDISTTFIDRFISLLELKPDEAKFFRALVNYNQTCSPHEKTFFFDQLVRLNKVPSFTVNKEARAFYREWHHSAIRALLDILDVRDDFRTIASSLLPPLPINKVRASIRLQNRLGLIKPDNHGFWKPNDKVIVSGTQIENALIRQFQVKCLDQAKDVLMNDAISEKLNITMTISLSEKARERIYERIRQFKSELRSIIHKDDTPSTRVYQLNLNLFPMSSKGK